MSTQSDVDINVNYAGDVNYSQTFPVTSNTQSPAVVTAVNLANGFNTIAVPSTSFTLRGVVIVPPTSNTQSITLKGVTGDTGIALSVSNPTFLALTTTVTNIGLTVGAAINGVRFLWL